MKDRLVRLHVELNDRAALYYHIIAQPKYQPRLIIALMILSGHRQ
jgi:hypothetical protein